ncbi:hypothetical protein [Magnetospira sp. QH-2]|uniref:hypothetical protein n=1 Tax=Magnetospira sp. (strain QH-2) TaxID=1288970 RepID=UPI0003E815AF|nr:hypothetical protein [Magnetospira sp. QH-2]CCQ73289.1 Exported protein of unknown function [Magnetospira sp. QH-2]
MKIVIALILAGTMAALPVAAQQPGTSESFPPLNLNAGGPQDYTGPMAPMDLPFPMPFEPGQGAERPSIDPGYQDPPYETMAPQDFRIQPSAKDTNPWLDPRFTKCILDNLDRPKVDAAVQALYMACRGLSARR